MRDDRLPLSLAPLWAAALVALGLLISTASAQQADVIKPAPPAGAQAPASAQSPATGLQAAAAIEEAMVSSIAQAERSVVAIARVRRTDGDPIEFNANVFGQPLFDRPVPGTPEFIPNEYATGVVIDADGLILTAHHVLQDNSDYWVTTPDRKIYKVKRVKGADPRSDLAVLQIDASGLVPITFGDASKLRKGQIVVALGNPYAIARDGQASASWGIVANLLRKEGPRQEGTKPTNKPSLHHYGTLIHTDAKLNLGTSGGALVNLKGEMVGLTIALAAATGYEQSAGFALPVDETFLRAVNALKQGNEVEYGVLGVELRPITPDEQQKGERARVSRVIEGTPAARYGLRENDLITHVNGEAVRDREAVFLAIGKLQPDAAAVLTVERGGNPRSIVIEELSKYAVYGNKIVTSTPAGWRGLHVDYVTASHDFVHWLQQGLVDPQGSLWITAVDEYSPAWNEGFRANMIISHVGGTRVATPRQFFDQVNGKSGAIKVRLNGPRIERPERVIPPEAS